MRDKLDKAELCSNIQFINLYKQDVFIAIAHIILLLWHFYVSIDLQWEKWKLAFIAVSLQVFWQNFFRNVCE